MKFSQSILTQFRKFIQNDRLAQAYLIDDITPQLMRGLFEQIATEMDASTVDQHIVTPNEGASIKVDQIRAITDRISRKPVHTRHVIAIYPAESMNPASANALLKMLEEPPGSTCFILLTSKINMLLPTILSRVIKLKCDSPKIEDFSDHPNYQKLYSLYKDHPVQLYLDQDNPLLLSLSRDLETSTPDIVLRSYDQYDSGMLIEAVMQLYSVRIKKGSNLPQLLNNYQKLIQLSKRYNLHRSLNQQIVIDYLSFYLA